MAFKHGVYKSEVPTSVVAPAQGYASLPFVVGIAPVHLADRTNVNRLELCYTFEEAVEKFGYSEDWRTYSLSEFMYVYFVLYGCSPCVLVNVYDPAKHDDPNVHSSVIIGGVDAETGQYTGLELVHQVFPKFRLVPGLIGCTKYSAQNTVGAIMAAKAENVSGLFTCTAVADVLTDSSAAGAPRYGDVPELKSRYNLASPREILCWPKVRVGERQSWFSNHIISLLAKTDREHDDVPYKSPSNEQLQISGTLISYGPEVSLTLEQANYLNSQGVVTALNWTGGWRAWGNRTAAYPAVTDVKDCFIPVRRMMDWIGNTFINTFWQKVDAPMTPRLIRTIVNSFNMYLNSLVAREMLLGGRVEFREDENAATDLMNGILRFHVFITPPMPAETIEGIFEYDPQYLSVLYEALN